MSNKTALETIKVMPITHCKLCPFGITKGVNTKSPLLVCRHPALKKEKIVPKSTYVGLPIAPPRWCELIGLHELVLKNRHEVIKIIEETYGKLHINPFDKPKRKVGSTIWKWDEKTKLGSPFKKGGSDFRSLYKRHWETRMSGRYRGKADPSYLPWRKKLKKSSTKSKKDGRKK